MEDTISAITTATGLAAVGIVRLSGPKSLSISREIFLSSSKKHLDAYPKRSMVYGHIFDHDEAIDEVLAVYMPAPHSYTAEDVVEIQCHGGTASLQKILGLTYQYGARPAEPGEFTKRAFLNGRIDLVQAEAVMDIINAKSEAALRNSLRLQEGYLSKELKEIRQQLLDVIVNLEAVIDYPEEDIEDVTYKKMEGSITEALKRVEKLLANGHAGRILREGLRTVIVGKPNVGKSSLLNQLLREDRALVSAYAGTTRDVIEEQLVVDGIPLVLADTAGIHATEDFVEQLGIRRSRELLAKAQLAIVVIDGTETLTEADQEILAAVQGHPYVVILNKADLGAGSAAQEVAKAYPEATILKLSAKTGTGLEEFRKWLGKFVYGSSGTMGDGLYVENLRQENLLKQAKDSLQSAADGASSHIAYDCLSIDINAALEAMGEITGQTASDEIISQIFARFCVGK